MFDRDRRKSLQVTTLYVTGQIFLYNNIVI